MGEALPKYQQVHDVLLERIQDRRLAPGDRVPSENELTKEFSVSRITAKRALDMIAQEGLIERKPGLGSFVRQRAATNRSRSTKKIVAVVQPGLSATYGIDMLTRLQFLTRKDGVLLLSAISENDTVTENEILAELADFDIDGYLIYPTHNETFNNGVLKLIIDGVPVVLLDRYLQDISCPSVVSANVRGSEMAMEHLFALGHRDIGVITRTLDKTSTLRDRLKGVQNSCRDADLDMGKHIRFLELNGKELEDPGIDAGMHEEIVRFIRSYPRQTAFFAFEYGYVPIIESVVRDLGLTIPGDYSLICFDAPLRNLNLLHPVTHIKQNEAAMAETAYRILRQRMDGRNVTYQNIIDVTLVPGETTVQRY